jgi:hypothetical protein
MAIFPDIWYKCMTNPSVTRNNEIHCIKPDNVALLTGLGHNTPVGVSSSIGDNGVSSNAFGNGVKSCSSGGNAMSSSITGGNGISKSAGRNGVKSSAGGNGASSNNALVGMG